MVVSFLDSLANRGHEIVVMFPISLPMDAAINGSSRSPMEAVLTWNSGWGVDISSSEVGDGCRDVASAARLFFPGR